VGPRCRPRPHPKLRCKWQQPNDRYRQPYFTSFALAGLVKSFSGTVSLSFTDSK
jgi:hypothetical protein